MRPFSWATIGARIRIADGLDMRAELSSGWAGADTPLLTTPPPFASGAGLLGFMGWRRKRKTGLAAESNSKIEFRKDRREVVFLFCTIIRPSAFRG